MALAIPLPPENPRGGTDIDNSHRPQSRCAARLTQAQAGRIDGTPLTFDELGDAYPERGDLGDRRRHAMHKIASLGFCSYIAWHHGAKTRERVTTEMQARLDAGSADHTEREERLTRIAEEAPPATETDLRDALVDLEELPEVPASFEVDGVGILARMDSLGRGGGHLVVGEAKPSVTPLWWDQLIQVWGYCVGAPGATRARVHPEFKAKHVYWYLESTTSGERRGPFPFTDRLHDTFRTVVRMYTELYDQGAASSLAPEGYPGPTVARCRGCRFRDGCSWRVG